MYFPDFNQNKAIMRLKQVAFCSTDHSLLGLDIPLIMVSTLISSTFSEAYHLTLVSNKNETNARCSVCTFTRHAFIRQGKLFLIQVQSFAIQCVQEIACKQFGPTIQDSHIDSIFTNHFLLNHVGMRALKRGGIQC